MYLSGCGNGCGLGFSLTQSDGGSDVPWWQGLLNAGEQVLLDFTRPSGRPTYTPPYTPPYTTSTPPYGGYAYPPPTNTTTNSIPSELVWIGGAVILLLLLSRK